MKKILVVGASGQIGTDLTVELRRRFGEENVIASDIKEPSKQVLESGVFEILDVLNKSQIESVVDTHQITEIYHLAAILSGNAEKAPKRSWDINMEGLFNVLDVAKEKKLSKIFWPSSIAVFGPTTPSQFTPQDTIMDPNTVYGISKLAGERWCEYYYQKFGVDVRSLRYPGLISYTAEAGGGTTDYAVDIFYKAIQDRKYTCFLKAETALPMMFMEDAINATIGLMEAPAEKVKIRSSYNLGGISFDPQTLANAIRVHMADFTIDYEPDFRQAIADSWPKSIDDVRAREDWGWEAKYDLEAMTKIMLDEVAKKFK
ncbi:MAG: NAD-dependent epimerase/dehydratase family protein [Bacteroidales bacterium]|nr:NAD-dependent epimerase/dehydratase family protein [Bacteroidales bacterium]